MRSEKWLIGLQGFNAVTAILGGIGLMAGWVAPGPEYLKHTDFPSFFIPGIILFAVVGGSALLASITLVAKIRGAQLISLIAGLVMLFWIVGEVVSIREFHFLQIIYVITASLVVYITVTLHQQKSK